MKSIKFNSTKQPVWRKKPALVSMQTRQTTGGRYHHATIPADYVRNQRLSDNTVFEVEETADGNILFKPIRR